MQLKTALVYLTFFWTTLGFAQEDTVYHYIESAPDIQSETHRIIEHGGRLIYNDPSRIPELKRRALKLARKTGNIRLNAAAYNLQGLYARHLGKLDSSIYYHKASIKLLKKLPPHIQLAREYNHLSITYHYQAKYDLYLAYNDSAVYITDQFKDDDYRFVLINNRAYILLQIGDTAQTKILLRNILPKLNSNPGLKSATSENLARIFSWQNNSDSALYYLNIAYEASITGKDQMQKAKVLEHLGQVFFREGEMRKARNYWNQAQRIFRDLNEHHGLLLSRAQIIDILKTEERFPEAIQLIDSLIRESRSSGYASLTLYLIEKKAGILELSGDFAAALNEYRQLNALKDSMEVQEMQKQIAELETNYQTRQKEQELLAMKKDKALKEAEVKQTYTLFSALLLILLLSLAYLRFYYKSRQKINEKERARLNAEVVKRQMEEQKLRDHIDLKSKQLTSKALSLSERNELLNKLKEKLRQAQLGSDKQRREYLKSAERDISLNLKSQAEWKEFSIVFEELNSGFTDSLKTLYPNLTQKEIRLLSLTKLGLNTRELSNLLHIAPDSIKMARYRLKKKLELPESIKIEDFLNDLETSTLNQ